LFVNRVLQEQNRVEQSTHNYNKEYNIDNRPQTSLFLADSKIMPQHELWVDSFFNVQEASFEQDLAQPPANTTAAYPVH